jgi:hypothetical protein
LQGELSNVLGSPCFIDMGEFAVADFHTIKSAGAQEHSVCWEIVDESRLKQDPGLTRSGG